MFKRLLPVSLLSYAALTTGCAIDVHVVGGASAGDDAGVTLADGGAVTTATGTGSTSSSGTQSGTGNTGSGSTGSGTTGSGTGTGSSSTDGGAASSGGSVASGDGRVALPPAARRGASVPYYEYEAEDTKAATTNGTVLPKNNAEGQITAEASGRTCVELTSSGQYVSFTLQHTANSIVVRYSIPDAPNGGGTTATLGLYVGTARHDVSLTSRYMYSYGSMSTLDGNPSVNTENPSGGLAHHFFDEVQVMFPEGEVPAGTTIKIQRDSQDTASRYDIDLVDFEDVAPPLTQPANSISITDPAYGAVAGKTDDATGTANNAAINKAIQDASAQGKVLWIPAGVFTMAPQPANLQNVNYNAVPKLFVTGSVTIQGAGMWYSRLQGFGAMFELKGNPETSKTPAPLQVTYELRDFALFGDVTWRQDTNSGWQGFDGPWGSNSKLVNVWVEHQTAGIWAGAGWDFPVPLTSSLTKGLTVHGARFRDLYADGINLNDGTSNATVEQTNVRNAGDDSLVTWSFSNDGSIPCSNNTFQFNTVQTVWHANCFAMYGGSSNSFQNNTCADTANMAGMFVATDFTPISLTGTNTIQHNTLTRAGGVHGSNDYAGYGALMFFLGTQPIQNVQVEDMLIDSPILAGIQFSGGNNVASLSLNQITVQSFGAEGAVVAQGQTYNSEGILVEGGVTGSAQFSNVAVSGSSTNALVNNGGTAFSIVRGSGNTGW